MTEKYIEIKGEKIPLKIQNYKKAKTIKILFKGDFLKITKPYGISLSDILKVIKQNEEDIYEKYKKTLNSKKDIKKQWKTGEKIYYKGRELEIIREYQERQKITIELEPDKLKVIIPQNIIEEDIKPNVDRAVKMLFKANTEAIINARLPYWSEKMGLKYNSVKVQDATTRYGSCVPARKALHFSSRLIMLPEEQVDAVIVHELCHMVYKYHDEKFYNLVKQYIPNYQELDKWLKTNAKIIMF